MAQLTNPFLRGFIMARQEARDIRTAKADMDYKFGLLGLEKKKIDADIAVKEAKGIISAQQAKESKRRFNTIMKLHKAQKEYQTEQIDQAEGKNRQKQQFFGQALMDIVPFAKSTTTENGTTYSSGFELKEKKAVDEKLAGAISNKGIMDEDGDLTPFRNREEAEQYVVSQKGPRWASKYPELAQTMDESFGPSPQTFGEIIKRENIKTKRQAIEYLKKNTRMSDDEIKNYIEENN